MARLAKDTPRLDVKFLDAETNEVIMEANNRSHADVGEMFVDPFVSELLTNKFGNNVPDVVIVMVTAHFKRLD